MDAFGWFDADGKPRAGFKTPAQGGSTSVGPATARELEGNGGRYLEDCNEAEPAKPDAPYSGVHPHALSPEAAMRLWAVSQEMTMRALSTMPGRGRSL